MLPDQQIAYNVTHSVCSKCSPSIKPVHKAQNHTFSHRTSSIPSRFIIRGDACPSHASMLRPASQAGPMHDPQWWGKLVNAALLSLINEYAAPLPSSRVNSSAPLVCRHDRVTREAGRVGLVGRDRGRRGY